MAYILAIDQGTTSSRAIIFSRNGDIKASHQIDLSQSYPHDGWVEQNANEIWLNTLECCRLAWSKSSLSTSAIVAIGISNQRETTILWDRKTGLPIYPAIVWQDRRTALQCKEFLTHKINNVVQEKTGLLLDPYFSATKISWILEHVAGAREKAECGDLAFGTVDSFLLWHLTKGKVHATDATNAARTMLFNIKNQKWDMEILNAFNIPTAILPKVLNSSDDFGVSDSSFFGREIPITGIAGDQQAAMVGQACFQESMVKVTYGTGCFMSLNTGKKIIYSQNKLLSTIAYQLNNEVNYALEGSVFSAGVIVKWLRDQLKIITSASETAIIAASIEDTAGVYLVPAFTGLGAPYWNPNARAAIVGLTSDINIAHIVRAGLEAIVYQSRDLLEVMQKDAGYQFTTLRVDGGLTANNWLLQFLSDVLQLQVERPACIETSALGAAYLAGLQIGLYQSLEELAEQWRVERIFNPTMPLVKIERYYQGWKDAVKRVL